MRSNIHTLFVSITVIFGLQNALRAQTGAEAIPYGNNAETGKHIDIAVLFATNLKTLFCLALLIFLSSCDTIYEYSYQVTNSSGSEITIQVESHALDSIYYIAVDETKVLFNTDHGVEGSKGPYFEDVSFDLNRFTVSKFDTLTSSRNYLLNASWIYHEGLYQTTITQEEFE